MKKILVIEDNQDIRENAAEILELSHYKVFTAENGLRGVETALAQKPDLILCDIMMPEMDGYEATQKIRREHKNNSLPIIAVTAKAMKGDREKCIEAGASDYITKPLKIDQLMSLMRVWLYKR